MDGGKHSERWLHHNPFDPYPRSKLRGILGSHPTGRILRIVTSQATGKCPHTYFRDIFIPIYLTQTFTLRVRIREKQTVSITSNLLEHQKERNQYNKNWTKTIHS
jgi:hypothetical protein